MTVRVEEASRKTSRRTPTGQLQARVYVCITTAKSTTWVNAEWRRYPRSSWGTDSNRTASNQSLSKALLKSSPSSLVRLLLLPGARRRSGVAHHNRFLILLTAYAVNRRALTHPAAAFLFSPELIGMGGMQHSLDARSILYQRAIYPPEQFEHIRKYGMNMLVTSDAALREYLDSVMEQIKRPPFEILSCHQLTRLVLNQSATLCCFSLSQSGLLVVICSALYSLPQMPERRKSPSGGSSRSRPIPKSGATGASHLLHPPLSLSR